LLKSADEISKEELIDSFIQREYQNRLFPSLYQALEYLHFNQCIHGADVLFPIFLVYYNETLDWEDHGDIFAFKNKADGSLDDNIRESHYFTMKAPDPNNITPITGALVFGENHFAEYHQLSPIVMLSDFKIPTKKIRSIS
jgi:hypothetical protein